MSSDTGRFRVPARSEARGSILSHFHGVPVLSPTLDNLRRLESILAAVVQTCTLYQLQFRGTRKRPVSSDTGRLPYGAWLDQCAYALTGQPSTR